MEIKINFSNPEPKHLYIGSLVVHFISLCLAWMIGADLSFSWASFGYDSVDYSLNGFETSGWVFVLLVVGLPGMHFLFGKALGGKALMISKIIPLVVIGIQIWLMFVIVSSHNLTGSFHQYGDAAHVLEYRAPGRWLFIVATIVTYLAQQKIVKQSVPCPP